MTEEEAMKMKSSLESKGEDEFLVCTLGKTVTIKDSMVKISKEKKKEHQRVFTPSVIEPSFGIGRIIYCLYEHSFYKRPSKDGDEQLNVFRFPPLVAPIKCTVFPLIQKPEYEAVAQRISKLLTAAGVSHIIDMSGNFLCKMSCAHTCLYTQPDASSNYACTGCISEPLMIAENHFTAMSQSMCLRKGCIWGRLGEFSGNQLVLKLVFKMNYRYSFFRFLYNILFQVHHFLFVSLGSLMVE